MDTRHKGELTQLKVQQRVAEKGYFCSKPTMEGCRYDLIVDDGQRLHRIQIKYCDVSTNACHGSLRLGMRKRSGGGNGKLGRLYEATEIDAVVVYLPRLDRIVWLPTEVWNGKMDVILRFEPSRNNQKKGVLLVENYIW